MQHVSKVSTFSIIQLKNNFWMYLAFVIFQTMWIIHSFVCFSLERYRLVKKCMYTGRPHCTCVSSKLSRIYIILHKKYPVREIYVFSSSHYFILLNIWNKYIRKHFVTTFNETLQEKVNFYYLQINYKQWPNQRRQISQLRQPVNPNCTYHSVLEPVLC